MRTNKYTIFTTCIFFMLRWFCRMSNHCTHVRPRLTYAWYFLLLFNNCCSLCEVQTPPPRRQTTSLNSLGPFCLTGTEEAPAANQASWYGLPVTYRTKINCWTLRAVKSCQNAGVSGSEVWVLQRLGWTHQDYWSGKPPFLFLQLFSAFSINQIRFFSRLNRPI